MRQRARMGWGFLSWCISMSMAATVAAQGSPAEDDYRRRLFSSDGNAVQEALREAAFSPSATTARAIGERIRYGMPMNLLLAALDSLRAMAEPAAGDTLAMLSRHRRSEIRLRAVQALVACRPEGASQVLEVRVADSDPVVRAAAASGLGQLGAQGVEETLFLALDRGVLEAAIAIGQVTDADGVGRLVEYVGRVPFTTITPALTEVLVRRDIPAASKAAVINRLEELGTAEVESYLRELAQSLSGARDTALRRNIEATIRRLGG